VAKSANDFDDLGHVFKMNSPGLNSAWSEGLDLEGVEVCFGGELGRDTVKE
jgi:hypothetical protein